MRPTNLATENLTSLLSLQHSKLSTLSHAGLEELSLPTPPTFSSYSLHFLSPGLRDIS